MPEPLPQNNDYYVGRFRVVRVLGRGSEGVVYLANDPKLNREVAIKTTSLGASPDPMLADLLVSTAQTASKLSHPNIVPVFEAGMHEGSPYVVFEYVEGRSLAQMLSADGPMPMARAIVMMSQILSGMAQIHERSLIHGDIKPANILVGENDRARVADFGLMRHERSTEFENTSGTLRYMAPECFGNTATDCRRDVYALGLVFYEMLTGEAVISRCDISPEQISRIVNEIPSPPSSRNPRVAPEIDAIVLKALRKDPARRFANAGEMKRELDRIRVANTGEDSVQVREATVHSTIEFLLRRMSHKSDFPALTASITSINRLTQQMDAASIKTLSDTVMRDFALTQKLLRLVNSAAMGAGKVTRVSDAITILGVGQLRSMATAMMIANGAAGKKNPAIAAALTDAFVAGLIARNVGRMSGLPAVEELFICGMFSPLGELLTIYYLPEEYGEIARRVFSEGVKDDSAARAVLGISFEELGIGVARHWQLPAPIVNALAPLPPGEVQPSGDADVRLWQCAGYARELCALARIGDAAERDQALDAHIARHAKTIRFHAALVRELMTRSVQAAGHYIDAAGFAVSKTAMLVGMSDLSSSRLAKAAESAAPQPLRVPVNDPDKTVLLVEPAAEPAPTGLLARVGKALSSIF